MEKYNGVSVYDVGDKFAELLREYLTQSEWQKMCADNLAETKSGICHSHDHCDANMVMADAMDFFGLPEIDSDNQEFIDFWNMAWNYAAIKYLCGE